MQRIWEQVVIGTMITFCLVFPSGSIPVISVIGDAFNGSSITIVCTIPNWTVVARWTNDNSFAGGSISCSPATCTGTASYTRYTFTTDSTGMSIEINPLMRSEDDGNWTCIEAVSSEPFPLYVNSQMNTNTSINVNTTDDNVGITCNTNCVYPHNTISAVVQYSIDGGTTYKDLGSAVSEYSNVTGCGLNEVHLTSTLSSSVCTSELKGRSVMFRCQYNNTQLSQTQNGVASSSTQLTACPTDPQCDYNWHILIGWVIGIFIIPIAGFVFFMFQFVMKKHSGGSNKKCDGKSKECKILVGVGLGVAVGLSLIICIIIATQVCLSKMGTALGIGIGVSFGIMFISVVIIAIIFFTCMKEKPDDNDSKPTTDKSEETNGKNNQIAPEKNESNKPNKKAETFNDAKPIIQDKPKNKALDEVPKGRQLPSPRKDDEENKIRMPSSLPPLNHEENSTSSPKKKKKKRKSKENENEDKSE